MRIILITILSLIVFMNSVSAITPINETVIKEAQEFGKANAHVPVEEFLKDWVCYEEKADKLDGTEDRSYVYTPFLLLAIDARGKALAEQTISIKDSENVLKDYADSLVFSVVLNGKDANFIKKVSAVLKQDGKIIKPFHSVIPTKALKTGSSYTAQCYFYFPEKDVISDIFALLQVTVNKISVRKFYFDLENMK